jgi:hypothetical protein
MIEHSIPPKWNQGNIPRRDFTAAAAAVAGLLAFCIQQIPQLSSGISNLANNTSLSKIAEELTLNVAQKILNNPNTTTLDSIKAYIETELKKGWINPALVFLQIIPLEEKEEDFYEYLKISITSLGDSLDLTLTTDNIDKAFSALMNMRDNFVEQLSQTAVNAFIHEALEKWGNFEKESLERTIDNLLQSKNEACMRHCFKYNCADIYVVRETQAIGIHIQFIDTATEIIDKFVPTGVYLIRRRNSGPTMIAQNTSGTQE